MKMDREVTDKALAVECIQCGDSQALSVDGTYALPRYAYAGSRFVHRFAPPCDAECRHPIEFPSIYFEPKESARIERLRAHPVVMEKQCSQFKAIENSASKGRTVRMATTGEYFMSRLGANTAVFTRGGTWVLRSFEYPESGGP
jgi:hypothetical protein